MRGERSDYDRWAAMGCTGWGYDDIFPYFLKAEQFHGTPMQSHGRHGPLSVSPIQGPQPVGQYVIDARSEEHTSELQSLMRISYAVFCLKKKINVYTLCIY